MNHGHRFDDYMRKLWVLCQELDEEFDGVACHESAAVVLREMRSVLRNIESLANLVDEDAK